MEKRSLSKEVWIGWISSAVEAYNMAIYSFIAPLFAPLLFPQSSQTTALFFSYFLLFIASGLLYPTGALYYGRLGDREGRQKLCIYSTLGLGVATGALGVIPLHWIYFLILIGAQYFFSGGEYHGSIVFSLEHSEKNNKGFMSACSCLFAVFGLVAASGLATHSLATQNHLWARSCFLLGAFGGIISYLLKKYCRETPAFSALLKREEQSSNFLKDEWQKIIPITLMLSFFIVIYSFIFIFLPLIKIEDNIEQISTFKSLIFYGVSLLVSGFIADKIGLNTTLMVGLCTFALLILPLAYFSPSLMFLQMILTFPASLVIGPLHSWTLQQFPVAARCRGIFISSAIATSLFGGSTVPLCLLIFDQTHSLALCGLYPLFLALFSFGTLSFMKKPQVTIE